MNDQLADISDELEAISERLGDISIQLLRDAVESGETKRPTLDKTVSQARRAVDKAARLLNPGEVQSSI